MGFYKKIIIGIVVVVLLGAGGYSAYLTFFRSEDSTVTISTKKNVEQVKVKDIKISGFTTLYGFYNNRVIGEFINDKHPNGSVAMYDVANSKIEYIDNSLPQNNINWGSSISPNGTNILYNAGVHGKRNKFIGEFVIYDLATNKKKVVKNLINVFPAPISLQPWSENGRYVVLAMAPDTLKISDILIYDNITGEQKELSTASITKLMITDPKVSNDGKRLYFLVVSKKARMYPNKEKKDFGTNALLSVDVNNVKDLRDEDENLYSGYFYLSKDNKSAIYSRFEQKKHINIVQRFFKDDKGRKENILIKNCDNFCISPNAKRIAYSISENDSSRASSLYTANVIWHNGNAKLYNKKLIYKSNFTDKAKFTSEIYWSNDNNSIAAQYDKGIYAFKLMK